jgi:hypothetical protein
VPRYPDLSPQNDRKISPIRHEIVGFRRCEINILDACEINIQEVESETKPTSRTQYSIEVIGGF